MSDFQDFYLDDDKCPECGTAAIYEIEEKSFGCKCTYELETDIELGKKLEQQRIIKLLEDPLHHNIQSPDIHKDCYTCVLVALIKGEQK